MQNIRRDKTSMDMTPNEFKLLTSTCWNEKYQPLTIDTTKDENTGRYFSRTTSIFVLYSIRDFSRFDSVVTHEEKYFIT